MLLIYTSAGTTSRFSYIAEVLFSAVLPIAYTVTQNLVDFSAHTGPKINYSAERITAGEIWVQPHPLLSETGIQPQQTACFIWEGLNAFFKTGGGLPFDIFAASFYLISRYEEYLAHEKDEYGRYAHTNSIAYREGFLQQPLVNLWVRKMFQVNVFTGDFQNNSDLSLTTHHSSSTIDDSPVTTHHSPFTFLPTYDIDIAYAYKGKGFLRNMGGFCKDLLTRRLDGIVERAGTCSRLGNDPFDTYGWLDHLHETYQLKPVYFFLQAEKNKMYDKNVSPHNNAMQQLIRQHVSKYKVGIHPSWQSGDDEKILAKEIGILRNIMGKPVHTSRQHYIRMDMPGTYRLLIANNITRDYSMGYGSINGFRASVSSPFYWYDLASGIKTSLLVHPFCFMEANSFFEQHYTAEEAALELQQYLDIVKAAGGQLVTIFHNHFITEQPQWIAWRKMYAAFLENNFA